MRNHPYSTNILLLEARLLRLYIDSDRSHRSRPDTVCEAVDIAH